MGLKTMQTNLFTTINEARAWVEGNKKDGCICPCCGQIAKIYRRKINSGMAVELIRLYRLSLDGEYIHHKRFASVQGGEISKLTYWGLVEEKVKDELDTKARTSGYWRITELGKKFVENQVVVKSHVYIFDSKFLGFSDTTTDIIQSLGNKFNYQELINNN